MVIAQLEMQPPAYKVALFLHCIGADALKIFNGFHFDNPDDRNDLAKIIQKFDEFTIGEVNETFERYTFNSRNQKENESIDVYVTTLRTLAKTCNFCDCMRDSIIRDRIVLGIHDHRTRKRLLQERNQLPVLEDILPELTKVRVFSTVDLKSGYWHCVLAPESSVLTTFATPYGRYRWIRLPFGLSASSEIFQKHLTHALENLPGVLCIADNILIYGTGETDEEATAKHGRSLQDLLQRCKNRGIVLNPDKMKLRMSEDSFMGHLLTNKGLKSDPAKVEAIAKMPKPQDVEGVQRLNGFVNYLAKFLPKLSDVSEPIRRLTRKDTPWDWSSEKDQAFANVQRLVTEAPVLCYYDPSQDLTIQCDASQTGLGAAILQNGKPIEYTSRALADTETRYAQIEKEMMAIVFTFERFNQCTFGRHVHIESDHKPLEAILLKPLARAPRRLQLIMMRLQKYDFTVHYERGKNMHLADMLSRAYLPTKEKKWTTSNQSTWSVIYPYLTSV